jgi:enoyl-CoA hydratase/carnithine racemase
MAEHILSSLEENIGVITLNRPESHNAITTEMWQKLPGVLDRLKGRGARVIVLTGQGDSFASGADLHELQKLHDFDSAMEFWLAIEDCLNAVWRFELPVLAMIQGPCFGGGCLLASACDLRYASKGATFGIPVARLGIILDDASIARLVALVGSAFAKQMLYTASTIHSDEALRRGLIDDLFDSGSLRAQVLRIAQSIAQNEAVSLGEAKKAIGRAQFGALHSSDSAILGRDLRQQIVERYMSPAFHKRVEQAISSLE